MFVLHVCLHATCVPGTLACQRRLLGTQKLNGQMVVSQHVSAGKQTWSSGREASLLNLQAISPGLYPTFSWGTVWEPR